MAMSIPSYKRTEGDGMENTGDSHICSERSIESWTDPLRGLSDKLSKVDINPRLSAKDIMKTKKLIYLKPGVVIKNNSNTSKVQLKNKEPKFVPYEPYKAAVRPLVPKKNDKIRKKIFLTSQNLNESCSSLECKSENEIRNVSNDDSVTKMEKLEADIKRLSQENLELERQLNYQVQVNGDLKNLLVAAVGEDMETRVHSLTEDKRNLAQALLKSAKTLSTHQEQVEWLASQCEVWRSKFLASSVMVEELAGWKASLSQKINEGQDVVRKLMDDDRIVRKSLLHLYSNLALLRDNFDLLSKRTCLKTTNIIDLSSECASISGGLVIQLLGGDKKPRVDPALQDLPNKTEAEKTADFMLKNPHPLHLIGDPDAACSAVMGAAVALSGQLYHRSHPPCITCCPQCTGEIQLV